MIRLFLLASIVVTSACSLAPNRNLPVLESVPEVPGAYSASADSSAYQPSELRLWYHN